MLGEGTIAQRRTRAQGRAQSLSAGKKAFAEKPGQSHLTLQLESHTGKSLHGRPYPEGKAVI